MKSRQFCSVCKQWLDMEVVPTGDGDDDGVVWFRCPQCQGFLPKLGVAPTGTDDDDGAAAVGTGDDGDLADLADVVVADLGVGLPGSGEAGSEDEEVEVVDDEFVGRPALPAGLPPEPLHEYAAMLAGVDPEQAVPYRPWESYDVGQCILHLAWNDCGVVVAKERLPGGRRVIKCWFQGAGVVRLIENAS